MTQGTYGGGTFGFPWGAGVGLYMDNHGRIYPQAYGGTPGWSLSAGYTPDLEGLLTGPSISGSPGKGPIRLNVGKSGDATGVGIGTRGIGVTHGFGPLEMALDFSRPWATPYIRDSAVTREVPSRHNVFEYGYPDLISRPDEPGRSAAVSKTPQQVADFLARYFVGPFAGGAGSENANESRASVFAAGAPPVPFLSAARSAPGGLPGLMAEIGAIDPLNPDQPAPGGLLGLIREYMRDNPMSSR